MAIILAMWPAAPFCGRSRFATMVGGVPRALFHGALPTAGCAPLRALASG